MIYLGAKEGEGMRGLNFDHLSQMQRGPDPAGLDGGPEDGRFVRDSGGRNQRLLSGEEEWVREMRHDTCTSLLGEKVNKLITN